uniref:Serine/threonine-protein phosphatase 4 regulatory subunit 3-like central domain-containing protein n=1 Tax=Cyanoderma ruficeps TaxID=181631 RepID=A0A8C3NWY1_9PASS
MDQSQALLQVTSQWEKSPRGSWRGRAAEGRCRVAEWAVLSCFPRVLLWVLVCYSVEVTQDRLEPRKFINLPTCEPHRLAEIAKLLTSVNFSRIGKKRLVLALKSGGFIPKLIKLFQVYESRKDTEGLRHLFDIVRGILCLGKASLFEVMFSDECILGVVGCLEYDPSLAQPAQHREFLTKAAKLHEAIPIKDPELKKKISQVFRAQYIQAIITPNSSNFGRSFLSALNSFIISRKEEFLHGLQKDEAFLPAVFAQLTNEATADEQRREVFLKEFCAFSLSLRQRRNEFLKISGNLGFLSTLEKLMATDDLQVRSAATDILSYLVEFSPATVQDFVLQEARQSENDSQLIIKVIEQMICTRDPEFGGDNQLMEIFCALVNTDKMVARISHLEVFEFLDIFYYRYIHVLTAPLLADTSEDWHEIGNDNLNIFFPLKENNQKAEILASVLEMLSFCVEQHQYHMKIYVIKQDLLRRTLVLMKSKYKFLALSALRFMRKIIGLKDELYNRYITLGNLFEPVVNAVLDNSNRCSLLKSALMEMFEFIRQENIDFLIAHIVENFSDALESVKPIHTFQGLKTKYEHAKDQQKKKLDRQSFNHLSCASCSVPSTLPVETFAKEPTVLPVGEGLQFSAGEKKAAPKSPPSSNDTSPKYTTLTIALESPKVREKFYGGSCPHTGRRSSLGAPLGVMGHSQQQPCSGYLSEG